MKILIVIIGEVGRYTEENNRNKYLTFASADKNKMYTMKCILWNVYKTLG